MMVIAGTLQRTQTLGLECGEQCQVAIMETIGGDVQDGSYEAVCEDIRGRGI